MASIRRGETYRYQHKGWLGGHGHLEGKLVVSLDNGGTGIFQTDLVEVRCKCCGKRFRARASDLI